MKISELIAKLKALKAEHGDLECATLEYDESGGCPEHFDAQGPALVDRMHQVSYGQPQPALSTIVQLN